jgi:hypothetical protein
MYVIIGLDMSHQGKASWLAATTANAVATVQDQKAVVLVANVRVPRDESRSGWV